MKDIFLLDLDDTLLDFKRAERENLTRTLAAVDIVLDEELYAKFHRINEELWKLLERGGITRERLIVERFERLFEECGIIQDARQASRRYMENFLTICYPFEGAGDFLAELKRRGRVYIVTNGGARIQEQHVKDAGFEDLLDDVFISESIGFNKPSKEYADYVKTHIPHFEKERAVWLGDSQTSDMGCAKVAEVDFVLFSPAGAPPQYEGACARNFAEALELMR